MFDKYTGFNTDCLKGHSLRDKAIIIDKFAHDFAAILRNQYISDESEHGYYSSDTSAILRLPLHVAQGNAKTGETPSISFVPIGTCSEFARRTCGAKERPKCYALKSLIYPNVCINLLHNTIWLYIVEIEQAKQNSNRIGDTSYLMNYMENAIVEQLPRSCKVARWHVAGDINSEIHLNIMSDIAYSTPDITWYTYTKSFDIMRDAHLPDNLKILLSDWCGENIAQQYPDLAQKHHVAYVDDGHIDYIPQRAFRCKGNGHADDDAHTCATCGYMCSKGINIVFPIH